MIDLSGSLLIELLMVNVMGRNVVTTTLHAASSKTSSLRTTVPMWVINQFGLKAGDGVNWKLHVQDGKMIVIMSPVGE